MGKDFLKIFLSLTVVLMMLSGCEENAFDIPLENAPVEVDWLRLERDFTGLETKPDYEAYNDSLKRVYGGFYQLYAGRVMNFGDVETPQFENQVSRFLLDKDMREIHLAVDSNFKSIDTYQEEISTAFRYYKHYFPEKNIPVVASVITAFSRNVIVTDSVLGVSLDMYLGPDHRLYTLARVPGFIKKKASADFLPYDMMRGWLLSEFEPVQKKDDLLAQMIGFGKAIYIMDAVFPFAKDHHKIGFTADEIKWCKKNEAMVWARLIEENQLYSTDVNVLRALTGPGPFTPGFPKEAPAQLGFWVGWQIVRSYMQENSEITITQLLEMEDAQLLLRHSKYKPR